MLPYKLRGNYFTVPGGPVSPGCKKKKKSVSSIRSFGLENSCLYLAFVTRFAWSAAITNVPFLEKNKIK